MCNKNKGEVNNSFRRGIGIIAVILVVAILAAVITFGSLQFAKCNNNCNLLTSIICTSTNDILLTSITCTSTNDILLTSIICISIIAVAIIIAFVVVCLNSQKVELEKERLEKLKEINNGTQNGQNDTTGQISPADPNAI